MSSPTLPRYGTDLNSTQLNAWWIIRTIQNDIAAIKAAAGIVKIHAHTIRPATPHLTADKRRVAPTPTIDPVMVCVVETGVPVSVT